MNDLADVAIVAFFSGISIGCVIGWALCLRAVLALQREGAISVDLRALANYDQIRRNGC